MTDGTSQGLFVVVAIVIFGVFVALSYTVFGDTLKPSLVGLFENATEQSMDNLDSRNTRKLTPRTQTRGYTTLEVDDIHKYNDSTTTKLWFNGAGRTDTLYDDLIFWVDDLVLNERYSDGTITLDITAKSDTPVELHTRLGGSLRNEGIVKGIQLTDEWESYSITFDFLGIPSSGTPAFVSWLEEENTIWISNYTVTARRAE